MFDLSYEVTDYHDVEVTLPQETRNKMRDRRDANRKRLKKGLSDLKKKLPSEHKSQGSYAMKSMVQDANDDYDIDDGAYFERDALKGSRGADMSALDVRQMIRDAIDDGSFKVPPELKKNCVRVLYDAGYHVDIPVYRISRTFDYLGNEVLPPLYELASSDWTRSDARDVTSWFEAANISLSPDSLNGRQLRRIVRLLKKLAKSRASWKSQTLSGFGITVLVVECFRGNQTRDDLALYDTLTAIVSRLEIDLIIHHPCTPGATITAGPDDSKARFFRDKMKEMLSWLAPLFNRECTREEALKCWDDVFNTMFFTDRLKKSNPSASVLTSGLLRSDRAAGPSAPVVKDGGGKYA